MGTDRTVLLRNSPCSSRLNGRHVQLLRDARDELINLAGFYMRRKDRDACYECLNQAGRITSGLARRQRLLMDLRE